MLQIKGLQKTSLIDYPKKISCVVFLSGCNFKCGFCHNKDLVLDSSKLESISFDEFYSFLDRRSGKLEGVSICGGEPCLNSELVDFISKIKEKGYLVKLDTNGSFPDVLEKLIMSKLVDYVAMDVKYPFSRYNEFEKKVRKSIKLLIDSKIDHEFRTTVVPGMLSKKDLISIAESLKGGKRLYLQQFRNKNCLDKSFEKIVPFSKEKLEEFGRACGKFLKCYVRGG